MGETENKYVQVNEGTAIVELEKEKVFLNPVQVMNRDLSIIVINSFCTWREKHFGSSNPLLILEPLAASGLRSIRYAKEIKPENLLGIISGDLSEDAADSIRRQRQLNEVSPRVLSSICAEGTALMNCFASLSTGSPIATFIPELPASASDEARKDAERISSYLKDGRRPHVIDIDPYGSVSPFIDGAVRAVATGGLLCITSTDASVLCGNNPEVSFYKYGGTALKSQGYIHEMSLRLIIQMVRAAGSKYKRFVYPLCAFSLDFYIRMFVLVIDSANACKYIPSSTSVVHQCVRCDNFATGDLGVVTTKSRGKRSKSGQEEQNFAKKSKAEDGNSIPHENQDSKKGEDCRSQEEKEPEFFKLNGKDLLEFYKHDTTSNFKPGRPSRGNTCEECGAEMWIGGPFYNGPLHDKTFMEETLEALDVEDNEITRQQKFRSRVKSLLTAASEDLPRPSLFLSLPNLCKLFRVSSMNRGVLEHAIKTLGYEVSAFHRDPQAIKTTAPNHVLFDIMRMWSAIQKDIKNPNPHLRKEYTNPQIVPNIVFDPKKKKVNDGKPRWLPNPHEQWGPAKRGVVAKMGPKLEPQKPAEAEAQE